MLCLNVNQCLRKRIISNFTICYVNEATYQKAKNTGEFPMSINRNRKRNYRLKSASTR